MKALTTGFCAEPKSARTTIKSAIRSFVATHEKSLLAVLSIFSFLTFFAAVAFESEVLTGLLAIPAAAAMAALMIDDSLTRNIDTL